MMMIDDDDDDDDDSLSSDAEEDEKSSLDFFSLENPETEREFFAAIRKYGVGKWKKNEQRFAIFLASSTFARRSRAGERATATEGRTGKTSFVSVVEEERWWW